MLYVEEEVGLAEALGGMGGGGGINEDAMSCKNSYSKRLTGLHGEGRSRFRGERGVGDLLTVGEDGEMA